MARIHRVAGITAFTLIAYFLALFAVLPVPFVSAEIADQILPTLPWWALVSFGSYALWSLGMGLYTFRDCPEAYEDLMKEINMAKNELRVKGVSVD